MAKLSDALKDGRVTKDKALALHLRREVAEVMDAAAIIDQGLAELESEDR